MPEWWVGRKHSKESREKMRAAHSGNKNHFHGKHHKAESLKKMSASNIGHVPWNKGKPRTDAEKAKISAGRIAKGSARGEKNPNWRGGLSSQRKRDMSTTEYREWRTAVLSRDDYTCADCGQRGGDLEADHIKPWAYFPHLRYDIPNGATRCVRCHRRRMKDVFKFRELGMTKPWVGVDFDGVLVTYDVFRGVTNVGQPIMPMIQRVRKWLRQGVEVRIFTARVSGADADSARRVVENWCSEYFGRALQVTNVKDHNLAVIFDDNCIQVEMNTGRLIYEVLGLAEGAD